MICPLISEDATSILEATACDTDNAPLELNCPVGHILEIACAFYGLHPSITKCILPTNVGENCV